MAQFKQGTLVRELSDARAAEENFIVDLKCRCIAEGASDSNIAAFFAKKAGLSENTGRKYLNNPGIIQTETLQRLVKALHPDIGAVLRFLGYSNKDIQAFAESLTAAKSKADMNSAVNQFAQALGQVLAKAVTTQ